jgi:hypothetical protein
MAGHRSGGSSCSSGARQTDSTPDNGRHHALVSNDRGTDGEPEIQGHAQDAGRGEINSQAGDHLPVG